MEVLQKTEEGEGVRKKGKRSEIERDKVETWKERKKLSRAVDKGKKLEGRKDPNDPMGRKTKIETQDREEEGEQC